MTLFYGLKRNQAHNAAILHPILFLTRRAIFATIIVTVPSENEILFGALVLLLSTMCMCVLLFHEFQWDDTVINVQHAINEAFMVLLSISLMLFSGVMGNHR